MPSKESSELDCCNAVPRLRPSSRSVRMTAAPAAPAIRHAATRVTRVFQRVRCIVALCLAAAIRSVPQVFSLAYTLQQHSKSVEEGGGEDHPDLSSPPPHTTPRGGIGAAQMAPDGKVERCQKRKGQAE